LWTDKEYHQGKEWYFAYDKGSHEKSAEIHGQAVFTGESVGRQILRRRQRRRDSRERGYSFIVSKNPNSSDQMMVSSII